MSFLLALLKSLLLNVPLLLGLLLWERGITRRPPAGQKRAAAAAMFTRRFQPSKQTPRIRDGFVVGGPLRS